MKMIFEYIFWVDIGSRRTNKIIEHNALIPYQSHIKINTTKEFLIGCDVVQKYVIGEIKNSNQPFYKSLKLRLANNGILEIERQVKVMVVNMIPLGEHEVKER